MPFAKPLARTREYVSILRDIWAREGPAGPRPGRTTRCRCRTAPGWASR